MGPHTGKNGFGHFCRNKSASSRGDETHSCEANLTNNLKSRLASAFFVL